MIPSTLVAQLEQGLRDFLLSSFSSTTPGFDDAIARLLAEPGRLVKGPYIQVALPFVRGSRPDWFPRVPLPFTPHRHQELAFARLGGTLKQSTLIATGTGSGKSESFLWPILAHCEAHAAEPGIKAILIYPMNALASDQALRIARAIEGNPNLRGKVRAGLYIGDDGEGQAHGVMGSDHVITDRSVLKQQPPDILLTNYKMLDYLMVRPRDRHLWKGSTTGSVRFLVVDELHTFDGAQGTDLACLIRRLKARLHVEPGQLCCIGTSATLGGPDAGDELRAYAAQVFGEPFDAGAVVGEVRQNQIDYFRDALITEFRSPGPEHKDALTLASYERPEAYLAAQVRLWFGDAALDGDYASDVWKVGLGARLREHAMLRNVLARVSGAPRDLAELVGDLARAVPAYREDAELGRRALTSFLSLVSVARTWREELPSATEVREARGAPRPTDAFLHVRVQLWQRELRRMVASVGEAPSLRFFDDLNSNDQRSHLPVIHCRDCGAMGWATLRRAEDPGNLRVELRTFYSAFFAGHPHVRFLFPVEHGGERKQLWNQRRVHVRSLQAIDGGGPETEDVCSVWEIAQVRNGETHRDCPFCGARSTLALIGFQAATLTSAFIDQLFSSPWNADKKLLAFSDSVQDASHRAGFFGARTWRFNIRVALARYLLACGPCSLAELATEFPRSLHDETPASIAAFVGTFIPPNLEWMRDYDALRDLGTVPAGSNLPGHVERRLEWEVFDEFGLRSRLGRSFVRSAFASAAVSHGLLDTAVNELLDTLSQQVGWLRGLQYHEVRSFLVGFLHHLRERGGILHSLFPQTFIDTAGKNAFMFMKTPYLPDMSVLSRLPVLLADREEGHFDHPGQSYSWYARWCERTLGKSRPLFEAQVVFSFVLATLTRLGILATADTKQPAGHCWGLDPHALQVTTRAARVVCDRCGHSATITADDGHEWDGMPCLSARCAGAMHPAPHTTDYFADLYAHGEVARIVATEHTGLLQRSEREDVEARFKRSTGRQPWDPNLLSCTPTLEMGIDIGDLSSVMLCSVPPAQANYLQRIGRAGRRDGNSLVVTLANARNHDLYFFEDPAEMMAGEIRPPGLYLDASAVLERQLTAWCFDRWAEMNDNDHALPRTLREIYPRLEDDDTSQRFPHDLRDFINAHRTALFEGFKAQFGAALLPESLAQLRVFLEGDDQTKAGLARRIYEKLYEQREQSEDYRRQIRRLHDRIEHERSQPIDDARKDLIDELTREHAALASLRRQFDERETLEFFTDEGLLPNYAFPEAAVRLRSVIWRKKDKDADGYETFTYKYDRPGEAALSELAPDAVFYAGGRHVKIDRVDLQASGVEPWRFCDQCDHAAPEVKGEMGNACPMCGSSVWPDTGRVLPLVQLRQVFAGASDRESRTGDDRDDRVPMGYLRETQVTFKADARASAWVLGQGSEPFGWEYISRASFREINYGAQVPQGNRLTIGGKAAIRAGFVICKECGQLQSRGNSATAKHAPSCKARNPTAAGNFVECVYLYRAFDSEAVRILLPVVDFASSREVQSLVAGIRTGLRLYFGGRVDHLRMTLESEPVKDSTLRRQYLVLYDSIPGGTGYLAQFVRDPAHLFTLLERARQHLIECGCASEAGRDGCYRCVFAYRSSYEMDDISRNTAISLLSSIIGRRDTLEEVTSLSDVSVKGLIDSALERKFIEVLRRAGTDARPSTLTYAFVKGKPGWRWQIGDRSWMIEPQRNHAANDGFGVGISIDFVFHPSEGVPAGEPTFAVFLDGWQYHGDRVGFDMLQRMSAKASGRYVVWSFTWDDVARVLNEGEAEDVALLLPVSHAKVAPLAAQLKLGVPPSEILERTSLSLFAARLAGDVDARKLRVLAGALLLAPVQPLLDSILNDGLEAAAPEALRAQLALGTAEALGHIDAGGETFPAGRVVVIPQAAVSTEFAALGEGKRLSALRAVFTLGASRDEAGRRRAWAALLRTSNLLSELAGMLWFVARPESDALDYQPLAELAGPQRPTSSPWDRVRAEVGGGFRALIDQLAAAVVELPEVGIDLPDERGRAGDLQAELAWDDRQVAVLDDASRDGAESRVAPGWRLFSLAELTTSLTPLLEALRERGGTLR